MYRIEVIVTENEYRLLKEAGEGDVEHGVRRVLRYGTEEALRIDAMASQSLSKTRKGRSGTRRRPCL